MKTPVLAILIACILTSFPLSPRARADCREGCDNSNTFLGEDAFLNNTTGLFNTAIGSIALTNNTLGVDNTAIGANALTNNTSALENTAVGYSALMNNTVGDFNTAIGAFALTNSGGAFNNTAVGQSALYSNTSGAANTAIGRRALISNTSGHKNIAVGIGAGENLTTGSLNIDIGNRGLAAESNTIRIGKPGDQTATYVAGISGVTVAGGVGVIIDTNGHLGTVVSSQRFKDAIKPMDKASEALLSLKPVTFRYKKKLDPQAIPQFGLVAEDVAKVDPDLVANDDTGKPYTVRYEAINAMLLNEFLKEHKKVEEQARTVREQTNRMDAQTKQIAELKAALKDVSARLDAKGL